MTPSNKKYAHKASAIEEDIFKNTSRDFEAFKKT